MTDNRKLFLKILKVELEETGDDISLLMQIYKERHQKQEITNYVLQENEALLDREVNCLKKLVPALDTFPIGEYGDNESFLSGLNVFLKSFVKENQFPHAVFLLADRKVQKVVKYIF